MRRDRRRATATASGSGTCGRVPSSGSAGRTPCVETSTGTGIAALAIAGRRVLWLHYTGGNILDVDAPPPIVVGDGDSGRLGDLLPYAVDRQ